MLFIDIEDTGLDLDLTKVSYVEEVFSTTSQLFVHFIGGDALVLDGWTKKRWQTMRNTALRQMQLQNNTAMGVLHK